MSTSNPPQSKNRHQALRLAGPALGLLFAILLLGLLRQGGVFVETASAGGTEELAKRGEHLVTTMGCNDCHTPWKMGSEGFPEPDMSRMLSGHPADMEMPPPPDLPPGPWNWVGAATITAFAGPWGVSFAANLMPHDTGLGVWTEEMFVKSMRTGKHMGLGRPIMPPMPWMWYAKLSDEELKAMWAYLRTVPPIENSVPDYRPPAGGDAGK